MTASTPLNFAYTVTERFLRYVVIDTQSDPASPTCPSTEKQKDLGRLLAMELRDIAMDFQYGEAFTESSPEAYERLVLDVLVGDRTLFPDAAEVEQSWRVIDPLEAAWAGTKPEPYRAGEWGPRASDEMLAREGRSWRRA